MAHSQIPNTKYQEPVTGFVLAGGKSSRMGTDKALLAVEGRTLLQRTQKLLQTVCGRVFILGSRERYGAFGECLEDVYSECGPLGGIHRALLESGTELNLITAVDTPFLSQQFLAYIIERARASGAVVTTPQVAGHVQPLCAVYSRAFLPIAETALKAGEYKIVPLFPKERTLVLSGDDLAGFALEPEMFDNLNTPEDFERARGRLSGRNS
jgi:molybdenum cofactor guanylyltransferase